MGPVRKYKVAVNGAETILKLNDEDAKAYPDAQLVDEPAEQPETTADGDAKATSKTRPAADKTRRASGDKASG
ncbi:hypothetical protein AB0I37_24925 [Micromonospora purpureochromogenes]|uniref:hypothetical protein n=1 Tax=Micromonospora purpureochromogenes TaxID=47872 RepID=UPI003402E483